MGSAEHNRKTVQRYYYAFDLIKVVDGDTFHAVVDLGFNITIKVKVRVARIDAPELKTVDGKACKKYVADLINKSQQRELHSLSVDKYGRALAEVYLDGVNLSDKLLQDGWVKLYA